MNTAKSLLIFPYLVSIITLIGLYILDIQGVF